MGVMLRCSAQIQAVDRYDEWFAIGGTETDAPDLSETSRAKNIPEALETAFVACRDTWWQLGKVLSGQKTAEVSHAAACASFGSDLGIMLAWERIVRQKAAADSVTLVICDDPWLFRQLAALPNVDAATPPRILKRRLCLYLRGFLSRLRTGSRMARAACRLQRQQENFAEGSPAIVVYGHPDSDADGYDAYFGQLMNRFPELRRLLHCDCSPDRAVELAADGRTAALHAWGSAIFALACLPLKRWRPDLSEIASEFRWIVQRAADLENGGGSPAMIAWQQHCQKRWLSSRRPRAISWPWENFSWERDLVRLARARDVPTTGYQHTVIGPHQFNYCIRANADGLVSIPDVVAANGPAYRRELLAWGMPEERIETVGATRMQSPVKLPLYKRDAPVFFALSGSLPVAERQLKVARRIADAGRAVLVKAHPMYPVCFEQTERLRKTATGLVAQPELSVVVYSTGSIALDAIFAKLPCVRLRFDDRISIDILPEGVQNPVADKSNISDLLDAVGQPPDVAWEDIFSPPDETKWAERLGIAT